MPKLFATDNRRKELPKMIFNRMLDENLSMGRGDLHSSKVGEIKRERTYLREQGYKVPMMPVCEEIQPKPSSKFRTP